ncbi:MAG: M24 family metallopeptidase [Dehalococcoidia bacterium]|nr:M24 family metallopeptidase [Dehalococcoidia bacterium]
MMALLSQVFQQAAEYMAQAGLGAWLIYDYHGMNPVFQRVVGEVRMVTRPCYLLVTRQGKGTLMAHHVDIGRFRRAGLKLQAYVSRADLVERLTVLLAGIRGPVAMEYSPLGALPRASRVDAGTVELVRSLGAEVVSSADLFQYATQRWSGEQLASHKRAASALSETVQGAFRYIGEHFPTGVTEYQVAQYIRRRLSERGLEVPDGPVVAADAHSGDPHYEPSRRRSTAIGPGQWVLIDLWAREPGEAGTFADITWVGYVGERVPEHHAKVFEVVARARDAALAFMEQAVRESRALEGWHVDRVARDLIEKAGYGDYFTHRLGHSLGAEVHADAVNLDDHETHDTRKLIPGIGVTIEPGIYLPEFGVRSEIDVYISDDGPLVTTEVQREVVRID